MQLQLQIEAYLKHCECGKLLSANTLRAYRLDLAQFMEFISAECPDVQQAADVNKFYLQDYVNGILSKYAPQTCKRKIACMKAFFNQLEFEDVILANPFRKIRIKFKEPKRLPKTMDHQEIQTILHALYAKNRPGLSEVERFAVYRDIACIEMLFSTGIRVGELCQLRVGSMNLSESYVRVVGKGNKERMIFIASPDVLCIFKEYAALRSRLFPSADYFFVKRRNVRMREEDVRRLTKHAAADLLKKRVTPHMFRHTFASMLLENNVDLKVIQELLGHASISTTQIYIHLTTGKLRDVLKLSHPRCRMNTNLLPVPI